MSASTKTTPTFRAFANAGEKHSARPSRSSPTLIGSLTGQSKAGAADMVSGAGLAHPVDRVVQQERVRREMELPLQALAMRLHCFDTDSQGRGRLPRGKPPADEAQDLKLAIA